MWVKTDDSFVEYIDLSLEEAAKAANKLLSMAQPPDAIFSVNDMVAYVAMKEIKRRGLRIPEDILLVGITDEFHATVVDPPLTSVMHPTFEIGRECARLFFAQLQNKGTTPVQKIMKTQLVIRESSVRKD